MLLKDYLLLNLGWMTPGEARRWKEEMAARRRIDASRDLLAFWQPLASEGLAHVGQLVAVAIFHPYRFVGELSLPELRAGLAEAVRQSLAGLGLEVGTYGGEVWAGETPMARVECLRDDGVLLGEIYLEMLLIGEFLMREIPPAQLSNAVAYHIEQLFGYAQAAIHPVAYEEQMRPQASP